MRKSSSVFILGHSGLIGYLAFLSAFVPISTDLYLPALPSMAMHFQSTPEILNLTLSLFILCFAGSMLIWGPFADKYGRKPVLLAGIVMYIAASIMLAMCTTVPVLIGGRCVQAIGSGAVSAVSMAIVKDCFEGRVMENVLTWIQTMTVLAPMIAPVLGGFLLTVTTWQGIFWVLSVCGLIALLGWFGLRETVQHRTQGSVWAALGRVGVVLRHRDFRALLFVFSVSSMSFMAYLATSAYIYEGMFHTTPQQYSYFFAANAGISVLGPILYIRVFREWPRHAFLTGCFLLTAIAGLALVLFGDRGPFIFALLFIPITVCGSALRPPTTMLMMNQLNTDNGTVASLIGSVALLFGGLSMLLCSLPWSSFITAAGVIAICVGLFCTAGWLWLDRDRKFSAS